MLIAASLIFEPTTLIMCAFDKVSFDVVLCTLCYHINFSFDFFSWGGGKIMVQIIIELRQPHLTE